LDDVVLKGADRIIYEAFSKRGDLSLSVEGVLAYVETEDERDVSVKIKAVSMKDFFPDGGCKDEVVVDAGSSTASKRKRKKKAIGKVHFIVDEFNSAQCVHETGGYMGNEPSDDFTSYYAACMIIRSIDEESRQLNSINCIESTDKTETEYDN
jgi:hypothetical protein